MANRYNGEDIIVEGIAQAMADCLALTHGDNIIVFYDNASVKPMEILVEAASRLGLREEHYNIDAYPRPLYEVPRALRERLSAGGYESTFYIAGVKPGELAFRSGLIALATGSGASHVHMPKVNTLILSKTIGCRETTRIIQRLAERLRDAREILVTTEKGTSITLKVGAYRWVVDDGIIPRGEWGNWPPGEVYTTPETANGVIIVDGVIGDYFSTKYGALRETVRVEVSDGKVKAITGGKIARELQDYLSQYPCGLRVGELGIGGNPRITEPIGNMLHDEKTPGAHIALGDPLSSRTGANWKCNVHVDLLPLKTTIQADGKVIVKNGEILPLV